MSRISRTDIVLLTCALFAITVSHAGLAQEHDRATIIQVEAQPLATALQDFSEQSGLQVAYVATLAENVNSKGTHDAATPVDALAQILDSTGLEYQFVNDDTVAIGPAVAPDERGDSEAGNAPTTATPILIAQALQREETSAEGEEEERNQSSSSKEAEDLKLEEIVVVGSRLGSSPLESALPVKLITREEIERSGATTIAQALRLLPEVSINNAGDTATSSSPATTGGSTNGTAVQLRGLPLGTTLVLVNGRRIANTSTFANRQSLSFFDLSNIPLSTVERIEVLPYGASAIYGGDGLAGAINIVLKRNAKGLSMRFHNGIASGYDEMEASVTWGQAWSHGSLTATASYAKSGTLRNSERALTSTQDFRRFGGRDLRAAFAGNPGTVYSLDGCPPPPTFCFSVPLDQRGNLPGLDAPVAGIPPSQDGQGLMPSDFAATAGMPNLGTQEVRFFSASETTNIALRGRYEIGPRLELFGDLLYSRRGVPPAEASVNVSGGEAGFYVVPAENPFNPFGVDVGIDVRQQATGIFSNYEPEYFQPQLGARGAWGDWVWELVGSLSKDVTQELRVQNDSSALRAALLSTDPATALNVFRGDGSLGSQELIESIFTATPRVFRSKLWQSNGFVRGPLAELPAGRVEALLGVDWQRQELHFPGSFFNPDDPEDPNNVSGSDESRAAFGEIRVPLFRQSAGQEPRGRELLVLTGAFRVDESDRFEETGTTETVGLEVRPVASLLLRGSYSSAFKPVSAFSVFQDTLLSPALWSVTDPKMPGGIFLVEAIQRGGIPPGLKPETSTSLTAGLVWTPESLAGLNLSVTAWENRLRNRIAGLGTVQYIVDNEALWPNRVIRDPQTGVITSVDQRAGNIARIDLEGVDLGLSWRWPTRYGDFTPTLAATWTGKYEEQLTPTSSLNDRLGVLSSRWAPRWKGVTTLGWEVKDQMHATLIGRYVSAYQDSRPLDTGPAAGTFQMLGDFWMFDLNVDLSIGRWLVPGEGRLSATRLSLGAINLFNRLPDFCNGCDSRGYDATQYDIRGRFAYAELRFNF